MKQKNNTIESIVKQAIVVVHEEEYVNDLIAKSLETKYP